jgi:hypothetical protein
VTRSDGIALLAVVVSLLSVVFAGWSVREQRRQWRAINQDRVYLADARFVIWRVLSKSEADGVQWGCEAELMPLFSSGTSVLSGELGQPFKIVALNPSTGEGLPGIWTHTVPDMVEVLAKKSVPAQDVQILKAYDIDFQIANGGPAAVSSLSVGVTPRFPDTGEWFASPDSSPVTLAPDSSIHRIFTFFAGLSRTLPEELEFIITLTYVSPEGEPVKREIDIVYHSESGQFRFTGR